MKTSDLTRCLARRTGLTNAQAADQLQHVIHEIVSHLRKGQDAPLPGLGRFTPGPTWEFEFDQEKLKQAHAKK